MNSHQKPWLYVNNEDVFQMEFSAVKYVSNRPHFDWLFELWNDLQQEFQWVAIFECKRPPSNSYHNPFQSFYDLKKKFYLLFTNYSCSMFRVSLVSR